MSSDLVHEARPFAGIRVFESGSNKTNVINAFSYDTDNMINEDVDMQGYHCNKPFMNMEITTNGDVWVCCAAWLSTSIGNILKQDIEEVWNGPIAISIRKSILNGKFNYCDKKICPEIQGLKIPKINESSLQDLIMPLPTQIIINTDESCNLLCPSCRVKKVLNTEGPVYNTNKKATDKIIEAFLTVPTDRKFQITTSGSGDPFASKIIRNMLYNINGADFPNLTINLLTSGTMLTEKTWNKMHKIHHNLNRISVSFDAGTKETYEQKTRLGGNWNILLKNCDFLNTISDISIVYPFVVQQSNYKELPTFVELISNRYNNAGGIWLQLVLDYGTWSKEEYEQQAIWKTTHSEYEQFLEVLRDPILNNPIVGFGNVLPYHKKAISTYI